MELIMTSEVDTMVKPKVGSDPQTLDQEDQHLKDLVEFFWVKVYERHRNATAAFRFFDVAGKGKVKKAHVITGLEKLRVRWPASDLDLFW